MGKGRVTTRIMREKRGLWDSLDYRHHLVIFGILVAVLGLHQMKVKQDRDTILAEANMILQHSMLAHEVTGEPLMANQDGTATEELLDSTSDSSLGEVNAELPQTDSFSEIPLMTYPEPNEIQTAEGAVE